MANFWDLPRDVRDRIYRLRLVVAKPISMKRHKRIVRHHICRNQKHKYFMPRLLHVSKQAEKEAAPIYYGENRFNLGDTCQISTFTSMTWPRHVKLVRSIRCEWTPDSPGGGYGSYGLVRENFLRASTMKGLEKLTIGVDEEAMLRSLSISREVRQPGAAPGKDLTPQQQLAILRFPAMTGLLAITHVAKVRFGKIYKDGAMTGGPLPGGPLLTHVLPRLRPKVKPGRRRRKHGFRFLDLAPEIRNRVYDLLLRIDGPIHPSTKPPTSAPKDEDHVRANESVDCESALSILAVSRQVHDETIGIFYNANSFVFYYPIQLNAFLLGIGPQRQSLLRDLTIHYYNTKMGGMELVDITFPMLKHLKCLKKLHVIMVSPFHETGLRSHWLQIFSYGWRSNGPVTIFNANPGMIPGVKYLSELRGLTDIRIRDVPLEEKVAELEKHISYPDFPSNSKDDQSNRNILQLDRAYKHFNAALLEAQKGRVNEELFKDNSWHTREPFPELKPGSDDEAAEEDEDESIDSAGATDEQEAAVENGSADDDLGDMGSSGESESESEPDDENDGDWKP